MESNFGSLFVKSSFHYTAVKNLLITPRTLMPPGVQHQHQSMMAYLIKKLFQININYSSLNRYIEHKGLFKGLSGNVFWAEYVLLPLKIASDHAKGLGNRLLNQMILYIGIPNWQ
ncbi:hypothetical protein ACUN24_04105 [Pedobacter sp. WC2501]|uniref:hypothetical protein n=1 Tax=Pedobacter sp. WC2501 TaxID=3461400 RepID=UPI0040458121